MLVLDFWHYDASLHATCHYDISWHYDITMNTCGRNTRCERHQGKISLLLTVIL
jgi:hypothetical protein